MSARTTLVATACVVAVAACSAAPAAPTVMPAATAAPATAAPAATAAPSGAPVTPSDYSNPANWLSSPTTVDKPIDVFYIYPTTFSKAAGATSNFSTIDDAGMVAGAQSAFAGQATAFAPSANIFAPYYRQVDMFFQLSQTPAQQDATIRQVPLVDVQAAFEYYLEHWNHGRPFILASHSQGSAVAEDILSDFMKAHPDVYHRMIVAYVVGQSITQAYLDASPFLKYATGPDDIGVIASWNSEGTTLSAPSPVTQPGGIAINPITWTLAQTEATAARNLGSINLDSNRMPVLDEDGQPQVVKDLADAAVSTARGVVVVSSVNPAQYSMTSQLQGVYHSHDYAFFYFDIRANAAIRVARYLAAHPKP